MRRTGTACGVVGAVIALLAGGCGGDETATPDTTTPPVTETSVVTETTPPATTVERTPKPKPKAKVTQVAIVVEQGRVRGGIKRPTVKKGARVRFVIRADAGEEVHMHGYEVTKPVVPGKATRFVVLTRISGRFEVELHHPDLVLAELTVTG
jgi:hypothetical protein